MCFFLLFLITCTIFTASVYIYISFSVDGLYEVNLDRRKLKTPGGKLFTVPNEALAIAVATEWDAQRDTLKSYTMHLVRLLECVFSGLLLFNITKQIVFVFVIAVVAFTCLSPKQSFQIIPSENFMLFFPPHLLQRLEHLKRN